MIMVDSKIVSHEGTWQAGVDNARAGIIMPGKVTQGSKYYQEVALGIAEDRAEIICLWLLQLDNLRMC
jgi:hypothetical protein